MAKFSEDLKKETEEPEEKKISEKVLEEWFPEKPELKENKEILKRIELTEKEREEREKLKERIEKMELLEEAKVEAALEAEKMKRRTARDKIGKLLDLAQEKGLLYSRKVAEELNDPYLLDLFHDVLVKDELYKDFPE